MSAPRSVFWPTGAAIWWVIIRSTGSIVQSFTFLFTIVVEGCLTLLATRSTTSSRTSLSLLLKTLTLDMPLLATIPTFHGWTWLRGTLSLWSLLGRWFGLLLLARSLSQIHWLRLCIPFGQGIYHRIRPGSHKDGLIQVFRVLQHYLQPNLVFQPFQEQI